LTKFREMFVPLGVEHLDFLPPWGRVYDGEVVESDDGEKDLVMRARELPQSYGVVAISGLAISLLSYRTRASLSRYISWLREA